MLCFLAILYFLYIFASEFFFAFIFLLQQFFDRLTFHFFSNYVIILPFFLQQCGLLFLRKKRALCELFKVFFKVSCWEQFSWKFIFTRSFSSWVCFRGCLFYLAGLVKFQKRRLDLFLRSANMYSDNWYLIPLQRLSFTKLYVWIINWP